MWNRWTMTSTPSEHVAQAPEEQCSDISFSAHGRYHVRASSAEEMPAVSNFVEENESPQKKPYQLDV